MIIVFTARVVQDYLQEKSTSLDIVIRCPYAAEAVAYTIEYEK